MVRLVSNIPANAEKFLVATGVSDQSGLITYAVNHNKNKNITNAVIRLTATNNDYPGGQYKFLEHRFFNSTNQNGYAYDQLNSNTVNIYKFIIGTGIAGSWIMEVFLSFE